MRMASAARHPVRPVRDRSRPSARAPAVDLEGRNHLVTDVLDPSLESACGLVVERHHRRGHRAPDHAEAYRSSPANFRSSGLLNRRVLAELDRDLRQGHDLSVTEFDILITLHNVPEHRLRMSSLGEQVMLSPAGVTHLVTRLERDGLVRREVDPSDRRKWYTVLTSAGDEALRAARRTTTPPCDEAFSA